MDSLELLKEFYNLGCDDEKKCAISYMVFNNLKEVCGYENIERKYHEERKEIYFTVAVNNEIEIYFPISSIDNIDLLEIEKLQKALSNDTKMSLILAICDPDSTVLYYRITNQWKEKE